MKTAIAITEPVSGLGDRELAAVLAGLRVLQGRMVDVQVCMLAVTDILSCGGTFAPLSPREIDALCDRLNLLPLVEWPVVTDPYEFAARAEGWARDSDHDGTIFHLVFHTSTAALEHGGATYDSWQTCCEHEGIGAVL